VSTTAYTVIIPLIRAAIGDFGIRDAQGDVVQYSQDYHDDDIVLTINLALLRFSNYSGDGTDITPEFASDNDKGAVAVFVALLLVLPGGAFSIDTPNMKYWHQVNQELIAHLLGMLKHFMDDGDLRPSIWGVLDQMYNEGSLVADRISEAVGAY